mgnify:CR=1 FL=1
MLGDDGTELPPASQSEEIRARDGGVVGARGASSSRAVAVATVVTTREYLVGALVMLHSLNRLAVRCLPSGHTDFLLFQSQDYS